MLLLFFGKKIKLVCHIWNFWKILGKKKCISLILTFERLMGKIGTPPVKNGACGTNFISEE